jgi:hypothetical protein
MSGGATYGDAFSGGSPDGYYSQVDLAKSIIMKGAAAGAAFRLPGNEEESPMTSYLRQHQVHHH